ncbi:MAG: hypothetical protein V9E88_09305 [Ferruginibacter sp.]
MKLLLLIMLNFLLLSKVMIAQTKEEIIKFNIEKVVTHIITGNRPSMSTTYYDLKGNETQHEYIDSNFRIKFLYFYSDSLLIQSIQNEYINDSLSKTVLVRFDYTFDAQGRITATNIYNNNVLESCFKNIYLPSGNIDTAYTYRKLIFDNSVRLTDCCRFEYINGNTVSYCYDSLGWKSPRVTISNTIDSNNVNITRIRECINLGNEYNCRSYSTKVFYKDGRQVRFEDEKYKYFSEEFYELNNKGLVTKHIRKSWNKDESQTQTDWHYYYFRNNQ